jgi:hypothetical protein
MTVPDRNARQALALARPLDRADLGAGPLEALTQDTPLPGGNLLRSILAIDR